MASELESKWQPAQMSVSFAMTHILLFSLLVLASEPARADDKAAAPDFTQYLQAKPFGIYLRPNTNAAWNRSFEVYSG